MAKKDLKDGAFTFQARVFADVYLTTNCNGVETLRRMGHTGNDAVLATTAWRLLRKVEVQDALEERRRDIAMGALEAIERHSRIARCSMDDVLDARGDFDVAKARETGAIHYVREVTVREIPMKTGPPIIERRCKMDDRQAAQVTLMKYHGLLTEVLAIKDMPKTEEELIDAVMREVRRVTGEPSAPGKKVKA